MTPSLKMDVSIPKTAAPSGVHFDTEEMQIKEVEGRVNKLIGSSSHWAASLVPIDIFEFPSPASYQSEYFL